MIRKKNRLVFSVLFLLILVTSLFVERFIAYQRWTLFQNGNWISEKNYGSHAGGLMGNMEFMRTRQALAGGKLHLAEWHGYNEISLPTPLSINELDIHFELEERAYLWIIYAQRGNERIAARLSRNPLFPSGIYSLSKNRERRQLVPLPMISQSQVHMNLSPLKGQKNRSQLTINSKTFSIEKDAQQATFSLKSGYFPVRVLQLAIKSKGHSFFDDFKPPWSPLLALLIFVALSVLTVRIWIQNRPIHLLAVALPLMAVISVFTLSLRYMDQKLYVPFYFYNTHIPVHRIGSHGSIAWFEKFRSHLFLSHLGISPPRFQQIPNFQWVQPNGEVLFLNSIEELKGSFANPDLIIYGTSQAWGAGAKVPQQTWFSQLIRHINSDSKPAVRALNMSVCGGTTRSLTPILESILTTTSTKAVLINLGSNDLGLPAEEFEQNFNSLIDLILQHNALPIVSLEPVDQESSMGLKPDTHVTMERIAEERKVPMVPTQHYFDRPEVFESGMVFWDVVHLDIWGQKLFADYIYSSVDWKKIFSTSKTSFPPNGKNL